MCMYDFSKNTVIHEGSAAEAYHGCYFDRWNNISIRVGIHQNPEWEIHQKIIENQDGYFDFSKNMIDVGAYIGIYKWNLPFQKGWLFEPNKESYYYCIANALLHSQVEETFIYNELISNTHEEVRFNGYDGMQHQEMENVLKDIDSIFYYKDPNIIMTHTLDDHLDEFENIGFIKTDCEGMDWKVLDGAENTIKKFDYPPILFENWPDYTKIGGVGPDVINRETSEEIKEREYNIRRVLCEKYGYEILWNWAGNHPDTHLAIKEKDLN